MIYLLPPLLIEFSPLFPLSVPLYCYVAHTYTCFRALFSLFRALPGFLPIVQVSATWSYPCHIPEQPPCPITVELLHSMKIIWNVRMCYLPIIYSLLCFSSPDVVCKLQQSRDLIFVCHRIGAQQIRHE